MQLSLFDMLFVEHQT